MTSKMPQDPHRDTPKVAKTLENLRFFKVFCFAAFSARCHKNAPQIGQEAPNMAPSSLSWVLLGASWPQDPANLASTWLLLAPFGPILAPSWLFQGRPKMAKAASKRNLEPRWPQIAPKTAPRPSQTPPDVDFSSVWGPFFNVFRMLFRSGVVQKRTGDGGASPQGVLDNVLYTLNYV